jgi:hypothetical protein
MRMEWKPIEEMKEALRDGREVMVRRVHDGQVVAEGLAVFGIVAPDAPIRSPMPPDPLGGNYPVDVPPYKG